MTEADFKGKSIEDRLWILYQAISEINNHGCTWASQQHGSWWKKLSVLGASFGIGFGFVFVAMKIIF